MSGVYFHLCIYNTLITIPLILYCKYRTVSHGPVHHGEWTILDKQHKTALELWRLERSPTSQPSREWAYQLILRCIIVHIEGHPGGSMGRLDGHHQGPVLTAENGARFLPVVLCFMSSPLSPYMYYSLLNNKDKTLKENRKKQMYCKNVDIFGRCV